MSECGGQPGCCAPGARFAAVLFDLGGTLLDYGPQTRWAEFRLRRMEELHGLVCGLAGDLDLSAAELGRRLGEAIQTEEMRALERSGRALPLAERLRTALAGVGVEADCRQVQRLVQVFCQPIRSWPRPFAESPQTLARLRELGARMAIITNAPWDSPGRFLHADLERWGLAGHFGAFVSSGDVPWRKPNPQFMWAAAKALGVAPEACLVVGDTLAADVAGARAAGMAALWVNRAGGPAPADGPQPDWTAASLEEVVKVVEGAC